MPEHTINEKPAGEDIPVTIGDAEQTHVSSAIPTDPANELALRKVARAVLSIVRRQRAAETATDAGEAEGDHV